MWLPIQCTILYSLQPSREVLCLSCICYSSQRFSCVHHSVAVPLSFHLISVMDSIVIYLWLKNFTKPKWSQREEDIVWICGSISLLLDMDLCVVLGVRLSTRFLVWIGRKILSHDFIQLVNLSSQFLWMVYLCFQFCAPNQICLVDSWILMNTLPVNTLLQWVLRIRNFQIK